MSSRSKYEQLVEKIKARSNPYAFVEHEADLDIALKGNRFGIAGLSESERSHVRALGNPYAVLNFLPDVPVEMNASDSAADAKPALPRSDSATRPKVSALHFRNRCRAIFGGYIPPVERGKLRPHHLGFIARNERRSPEIRAALLARLERYDLSTTPGLAPQFNRERAELTEQKLSRIEQSVIDDFEN